MAVQFTHNGQVLYGRMHFYKLGAADILVKERGTDGTVFEKEYKDIPYENIREI